MFRTIGKRLLLTKNRLVFIPTNGIVEFLPKRPKGKIHLVPILIFFQQQFIINLPMALNFQN